MLTQTYGGDKSCLEPGSNSQQTHHDGLVSHHGVGQAASGRSGPGELSWTLADYLQLSCEH